MSYPQQGGYPQQPYQPAETGDGTNPITAVLAALLALAVAAFEVIVLVRMFDRINFSQLGDLPTEMLMVLILQALAGLLLLLGAMFTFGRKMAGAVLIVLGALVAIATFFAEPLLLSASLGGLGRGVDIGQWLEAVFQFSNSEYTFRALTLIAAPLALIFAVLPSTRDRLRARNDYDSYSGGGYPSGGGGSNPVPGFPQQQPNYNNSGYNPNPNSGGFPQQGYPPQQGGQQGGGYPQQQGW